MLADSPCLGFCVLVAFRQLYKSHGWFVSSLIRQLCSFHGGKQGSGPDRGQSPVEWGDYWSVSVRPFPPLGHPAGPEVQPIRPEA